MLLCLPRNYLHSTLADRRRRRHFIPLPGSTFEKSLGSTRYAAVGTTCTTSSIESVGRSTIGTQWYWLGIWIVLESILEHLLERQLLPCCSNDLFLWASRSCWFVKRSIVWWSRWRWRRYRVCTRRQGRSSIFLMHLRVVKWPLHMMCVLLLLVLVLI